MQDEEETDERLGAAWGRGAAKEIKLEVLSKVVE